jgi:DinB superfamily
MSSQSDSIAFALTAAKALMGRYCADLTPSDYLHRIVPKANCAAWLLGHLILTERRALGAMGAGDLPTLPDGFESRFARDENAPFTGDYGDVTVLLPLFNQHRDRLIAAVKSASTELLAKPLETPRPLFGTVGEMAHFMALHSVMHAGQITFIRRHLGRPPLV